MLENMGPPSQGDGELTVTEDWASLPRQPALHRGLGGVCEAWCRPRVPAGALETVLNSEIRRLSQPRLCSVAIATAACAACGRRAVTRWFESIPKYSSAYSAPDAATASRAARTGQTSSRCCAPARGSGLGLYNIRVHRSSVVEVGATRRAR